MKACEAYDLGILAVKKINEEMEKNIEKDLNKILTQIKEAATKGEFSILTDAPHSEIMKELNNLGYVVTRNTFNSSPPYINIIWDRRVRLPNNEL